MKPIKISVFAVPSIAYRPNPISDPERDRWCGPQRFVDPGYFQCAPTLAPCSRRHGFRLGHPNRKQPREPQE
jgi:hypothetical protein